MRLIDADALEKIYSRNSITDIVEVYERTVLQHLKDAPTIDAVPVVRCKDCRYWDDDRRCNGIRNGLVLDYTDEDDFCSCGERRDDDA